MGLFGWLRRFFERDAIPPPAADMLGAATLVKEKAPNLSQESALPHVVIAGGVANTAKGATSDVPAAPPALSSADAKAMQARGYRNRNPGNIDWSKNNAWLGQVGIEATGNPPRFAVFEEHEYGIRALARLLDSYQTKHGLNTVAGIINRWAPPTENITSSYVAFVARVLNVKPDQPVDVTTYAVARPMVEAIIRKELGGCPYPPAVIDEGLKRAGVVP